MDPDGRENWFYRYMDEYQDFMTQGDKDVLYTLNLIERASRGDKGAQSTLKYAFHEANQEILDDISNKSGAASLIFLAIGCPEAASVFGAISMTADGLIAIDHFANGETREGLTDLFFVAASFGISKGVESTVSKIAKIQITVGKTGRYYEIGKRGAIKSESALRKMIAKDIASGYFGENISPEIASQIVEKAGDAYKKIMTSKSMDE